MRWFFSVCSAVLVAAYAALVITCNLISPDLTGPQDNSFFNPSFYGLAPGAAGGLTAAGADGQVSLAWDAAANTDYYEVFYGATADVHGLTPLRVTGTYTVIKELENNTEYYVWVRGMNSLDMGKLQGPVRATPRAAEQAPDAPEAPRAQAFSERVVLTWLPVEGAVSYTVWKSTSGNSAAAQKCSEDLEAPGFTVEGLTNETPYYFWIRAKNAVGESALSGVTEATPSASAATAGVPGAPVLTPGNAQLTASWQSAAGAERYELWIATENNSASAVRYGADVSGTSAVITGLTNETRYYVWLRAKNSDGLGGFSPSANAVPTVFSVPPAAPDAPVVTALDSGSAELGWEAVPGALAYEVWYGTANNSASAQQYGGDISSGLSAAITGLSNGTTYYVWLKAKNDLGTSGFSPAVQAKPIASPEPTLAAGNGKLTVTWTDVTGASGYDIFYGTGANPPGSPAQTSSSSPVTISPLTNGITYTVWMRGRNDTGTGAMSAAASAKPLGNMGTVTLASANQGFTASWTAVAGADSYAVYYSTTTIMPGSPAGTVTLPSATFTGLTNGTAYYVWVKPLNNDGAGGVSSMVSVIPLLAAPAAPTLTAADGKLTVSWAAVTGAAEYEVYYGAGTTAGAAATLWTTTASLTATITGLTNGTTYAVRLRAKNASGGVSAYGAAAYKMPTKTGLYKGAAVSPATKIGQYSLTDALSYISGSAVNGDNYFIVLGENENCAPKMLSYTGKTVGITLMADGAERTVELSANGSLFTVRSGVTLTLGSNVTLRGRAGNTDSVVRIAAASGGMFVMNGGTISGNTASSDGGGVEVAGGTFTMSGGEISGNTAVYGGGVEVAGGTFTMSGGAISGNTASNGGGGVEVFSGMFTMSGGAIISGNTAVYGGGVSVGGGTFTKSTDGVVYGSDAAAGLKNSASGGNGHAVYRQNGTKKRNSTIPAGTEFDSREEIGWD